MEMQHSHARFNNALPAVVLTRTLSYEAHHTRVKARDAGADPRLPAAGGRSAMVDESGRLLVYDNTAAPEHGLCVFALRRAFCRAAAACGVDERLMCWREEQVRVGAASMVGDLVWCPRAVELNGRAPGAPALALEVGWEQPLGPPSRADSLLGQAARWLAAGAEAAVVVKLYGAGAAGERDREPAVLAAVVDCARGVVSAVECGRVPPSASRALAEFQRAAFPCAPRPPPPVRAAPADAALELPPAALAGLVDVPAALAQLVAGTGWAAGDPDTVAAVHALAASSLAVAAPAPVRVPLGPVVRALVSAQARR